MEERNNTRKAKKVKGMGEGGGEQWIGMCGEKEKGG